MGRFATMRTFHRTARSAPTPQAAPRTTTNSKVRSAIQRPRTTTLARAIIAGRFGRWLSADWSAVPVPVPYANLTNPQTLNLYAMVADDPESFADLDGHDKGSAAPPPGDGQCSKAQAGNNLTACQMTGQTSDDRAKVAKDTRQVAAQNAFNPTITYDKNLSAKDLATAKTQMGAAVGLINAKWSKLTDDLKSVLSCMNSINVIPGSGGGISSTTLVFNFGFTRGIQGMSVAWTASDIAHDSFHIRQYFRMGEGSRGPDAMSRESGATHFQIDVGRTLGLSKHELNTLREYAAHPERYWPDENR